MKLAMEECCLEFVPPWQPLDDVPMVSPQKWRENGLVSVEFVMSSWDEQPSRRDQARGRGDQAAIST